ncbi:MAG: hypothetical protein JSR58_03235 [Verrucomicrobia bacterium]|nr:hypothetical protein [Verrucomicrobiota bacterium]
MSVITEKILQPTWAAMPSRAAIKDKTTWAFQKAVQGFDGYFGFSFHAQQMQTGLNTAQTAHQNGDHQETIYGGSRVAMGAIGLWDATSDIAQRASTVVANNPFIQAANSLTGIISNIMSLCDGLIASIRLSWMIKATDDEIKSLSEAQLQRRLGDDFPVADIDEFKRSGAVDILLRMRAKAKRNLFFRSMQVSIAALSLYATFTGAKIYATAASTLGNALFAHNLYENRSYYTQLVLDGISAIPDSIKNAALKVAGVFKSIIVNIDWFFEFSVAFNAANEARKRGDWQEVFHASMRIITNTVLLARYPAMILSNLDTYLSILDKVASSNLLSFLSAAGMVLSVYSFFEGLITSARLAWMIRASDKEIASLSAHQLNKRLGASFKQDIELFTKISQIPENQRTTADQATLEKLLPEMRAQAKRKLCIRVLQVIIAALSIAAIICTLVALPYIALPLSILAIAFMIIQGVMDGAWAENRGQFSLLNFLPVTEQKDFEAMNREDLIKTLGENSTDKVDQFLDFVREKNELGIMNLLPEMQEQARRKYLIKLLFIGSIVGAIGGVVAVAIGAFPIALGLAGIAAVLLALKFFLDHTWAEKQGDFTILPQGLKDKIARVFNSERQHEEAVLKEHYPWLQAALQSSHKTDHLSSDYRRRSSMRLL